jgi:hypothetical protein
MKHWLRCRVSACILFPMLSRLSLALAALALSGCVHVTMDPIQVHAIVDVNVKLDKALDDVFGDLDRKSATMQVRPN